LERLKKGTPFCSACKKHNGGKVMSDVLKGNFQPQRKVSVDDRSEELSSQFEREALKRLGGSIAFVSKTKFLYGTGRANEDSKPDAT